MLSTTRKLHLLQTLLPNIACMSESKIDFRATEYTGASGVYAIRYYVNGQLSPDNHRSYCILDSLQVSSLCSMSC